MAKEYGFDTYLSPFTYRYGSDDMRQMWSQENFWRYARNVWVEVAQTQMEAGIVTKEQLKDLRKHANDISYERIRELERDPATGTGHDVMAAIKEFSERAPIGGVILHQGLTSEDILSNVEIMLIKDSYSFILRPKIKDLLGAFAEKIEKYKNLVCMGYTHLQVAEPTTVGYRFSEWAQDLLIDLKFSDFVFGQIKGKGIKGAVGTSGSVQNALRETGMDASEHEKKVMFNLGLPFDTISGQTYPRKYLFLTMASLASIAQSLHRVHTNLKLLQSPWIDEVSEPRKKGQTGSTAMPHKQNPVLSENICALTRELPGKLFSAWSAASFITLERGLEDSAGKRSFLPEAFLVVDSALASSTKVFRGLTVHENSVGANLKKFVPFCVTEIILGDLVNAGMNRVAAHQKLAAISEQSVDGRRLGNSIPIQQFLLEDEEIIRFLGSERVVQACEDVLNHTGNAPEKCDIFLKELKLVK